MTHLLPSINRSSFLALFLSTCYLTPLSAGGKRKHKPNTSSKRKQNKPKQPAKKSPSIEELEERASQEQTKAEDACNSNNYDEALNRYKETCKLYEAIFEKIKNQKKYTSEVRDCIAVVHNNIAHIYHKKGKNTEAIKSHQKAASLWEKIPTHKNQAIMSYRRLAIILNEQGKYAKSLKYHKDILKLTKEGRDELQIAKAHTDLGNTYKLLRQYPSAIRHHLQALEIRANQPQCDPLDLARSHTILGDLYHLDKQLDQACKHYLLALPLWEDIPTYKDQVIITYRNLAIISHDQDNYAKSKLYHEKVLQTLTEEGAGELQIAEAHTNLGNTCILLHKYEQAKNHLLQALNIHKKKTTKESLVVAQDHYQLCVVYNALNNKKKTIYHHSQALEIRAKQPQCDLLDLASSYTTLADLYQLDMQLDQARKYYLLALPLWKKIPTHKDQVIITYRNLAIISHDQDNYTESKRYQQKILDAFNKKKVDQLQIAVAHRSLGNTCILLGEYEQAKNHLLQALSMHKNKTTEGSLEVALTHYQLGIVYNTLNKIESATSHHLQALNIRAQHPQCPPLDLARSYTSLGDLFHLDKQLDQALKYYLLALPLWKDVKEQNIQKAALYSNIGSVYIKKNDCLTSIPYLKKSLQAWPTETKNLCSIQKAQTYCSLGEAYYRTKDYTQALLQFDKSLQICLQHLDPMDLDIAHAHNNLGKSYCKAGKSAEAIKQHKNVLKIWKNATGDDQLELAHAHDGLGYAYFIEKKYKEAIKEHKKAINLSNSFSNDQTYWVILSYEAIGLNYSRLQNFPLAIDYCMEAYKLCIAQKEISPLATAQICFNLASILQSNAQPKEAINYYQLSLKKCRPLLEENEFIAQILYNIGLASLECKRYSEAISYYEKTLKIPVFSADKTPYKLIKIYKELRKVHLAKPSLDIKSCEQIIKYANLAVPICKKKIPYAEIHSGTAYKDLGDTYLYLRQYKKASQAYEKNLDLWKSLPHTTALRDQIYLYLGISYYNQHRYNKAIDAYQQALAINLKKSNPSYTLRAACYTNLGLLHANLGHSEKAIQAHRNALTALNNLVTEEDGGEQRASTYKNLGVAYEAAGQPLKALKYYHQSRNILETRFDAQSKQVRTLFNNIANVYCSQEKYDLAITTYQESLDALNKLPMTSSLSLNIAATYHNMGSAYYLNRDLEKALKCYKKTVTIRLQELEHPHPSMAKIYDNLGVTYRALGKDKDSEHFFKQADLIYAQIENLQQPSNTNKAASSPTVLV